MSTATQHLLKQVDGQCVCSLCGKVVLYDPWLHIGYYCRTILEHEDEHIMAHDDIIHWAHHALSTGTDVPPWLNGTTALPRIGGDSYYVAKLSMEFTEQTNHNQCTDISGMLLAGDGSGGPKHTYKDIRTR